MSSQGLEGGWEVGTSSVPGKGIIAYSKEAAAKKKNASTENAKQKTTIKATISKYKSKLKKKEKKKI